MNAMLTRNSDPNAIRNRDVLGHVNIYYVKKNNGIMKCYKIHCIFIYFHISLKVDNYSYIIIVTDNYNVDALLYFYSIYVFNLPSV